MCRSSCLRVRRERESKSVIGIVVRAIRERSQQGTHDLGQTARGNRNVCPQLTALHEPNKFGASALCIGLSKTIHTVRMPSKF